MFEKLQIMEQKFEEISQRLSDPAVTTDIAVYTQLMKEYKNLEPIVQKYRAYKRSAQSMQEARELLDAGSEDPELREMAQAEFETEKEQLAEYAEQLKILLLPKDPNDDRNVIIEIRGGAGGEEAALFANSLYRMYTMYAESRGWKQEVLSANPTELGGFKEISFSITGEGAYSRLKYESGVHRVQRVPITESNGKIQSSTCTVAVLPEAEDVELQIDPKDLRIDVYRSTGHGGQCVNTTDSAVRITHLPTGLVVTCQDQKSQLKNRDTAMQVLRSRLLAKMRAEKDAAYAENRRVQVGTGDRSERIRTYNFREGRVTDHRIGLTLYRIQDIIDGDLDEIIDALHAEEIVEKLREMR